VFKVPPGESRAPGFSWHHRQLRRKSCSPQMTGVFACRCSGHGARCIGRHVDSMYAEQEENCASWVCDVAFPVQVQQSPDLNELLRGIDHEPVPTGRLRRNGSLRNSTKAFPLLRFPPSTPCRMQAPSARPCLIFSGALILRSAFHGRCGSVDHGENAADGKCHGPHLACSHGSGSSRLANRFPPDPDSERIGPSFGAPGKAANSLSSRQWTRCGSLDAGRSV
jgi:hypothetical protein